MHTFHLEKIISAIKKIEKTEKSVIGSNFSDMCYFLAEFV